MADVRSVLDHLLEGRAVLVAEVDRLAAAIHDLDAVIGRLGGIEATPAAITQVPPPPAADPVTPSAPAVRRDLPARKAPTRRPPAKSAPAAEGGKSIRVHVLEMLEAEQRELGLAEIIDRIHAAGIRAHDDAVRSITIKLMKDGKVERVGRGQYRLASPSSSAASVPGLDGDDADEPLVDGAAPEVADGPTDLVADTSANAPAPAAPDLSPQTDLADSAATTTELPTGSTDAVPGATPAEVAGPSRTDAGYAPPLNLGQPWQKR